MTEADLDQLRAQHPLIGKRLGGPQQPVSGADVAPGAIIADEAGSFRGEVLRDVLNATAAPGAIVTGTPAHGGALFDEHQGSLVWVLDELWAGRAKKLAAALNKTPEAFLESLVHRAWTSAPLSVRNREL